MGMEWDMSGQVNIQIVGCLLFSCVDTVIGFQFMNKWAGSKIPV